MAANHDALTLLNNRDPNDPGDDPKASPGSPQDEAVAVTHGQKWAEFYEALDQLVHDQFDRSNELLREAMVLPTVADREVAAIRQAAAEQVAAERRRHGDLLQPVHDEIVHTAAELTQMQQRMVRLATRLDQLAANVTAAIEAINHDVPPAPARPSEVVAARIEPLPLAPPPEPAAEEPADEESSGPVTQQLIVHGVRQARLALSLQRHLYGLEHVEGVETREYQDGTVQLQVRATRPLMLEDLQSWSEGADIEVIRINAGQIEARLPESATNAGRGRSGRWWGSREAAGQSANGVH